MAATEIAQRKAVPVNGFPLPAPQGADMRLGYSRNMPFYLGSVISLVREGRDFNLGVILKVTLCNDRTLF